MKSVWRMTAPGRDEKLHGKHPTQKPLALLERIVAASCPAGGLVLDPFNGSGTAGVAAVALGHRYIGVDLEAGYLELTRKRLLDLVPAWSQRTRLRAV
jgi:site-specific DNA-methyltransferase (adenine-specific)